MLCCVRAPERSYESVRKNLHTGDIILFSGRSFSSMEIRCVTVSPYSHVGMVVRRRAPSGGSALYLWHAPAGAIESVPDVLSGHYKDGPQLSSLERVLEVADGAVHACSLVPPWCPLLNGESDLNNFMVEQGPKSYESDQTQLVLSALGESCCVNEEDTSSYFCSELVAETYKFLGLAPRDRPSNTYVPGDFSPENARSWMIRPHSFGALVCISSGRRVFERHAWR